MNTVVYPQTVTILDPNMSNLDKIGTMARICYRREVAEGETDAAVNERIIKNCIKNGHESVLEHAAYSLFLPVELCSDNTGLMEKMFGQKQQIRVPFRQIWESAPTISMQKYSIPFMDVEMYDHRPNAGEFVGDKDKKQILPCIIADARAWRNILKERISQYGAFMDNPINFLILCRIVQAFYQCEPVVFEDIKGLIETGLSSMSTAEETGDKAITSSRIYSLVVKPLKKEERTLDGVVAHYFNMPTDIFVGPTAKEATLSVIIETSRDVTHQLVRHRADIAYSQESQRYVNFASKGAKIIPLTVDPAKVKKDGVFAVDPSTGVVDENSEVYRIWSNQMTSAFNAYEKMLELGVPPEAARKVLPNGCYTKIGVTWFMPSMFMNFCHFRLEDHAQFDIRRVAADIIFQTLKMQHPFMNLLDPNLIKHYISFIQDHHFFGDAKETIEEYGKLVAFQDDRIKAIQDYTKAMREQQEALIKKAEEEARAEAEKARAQPELKIKEGDPKNGENVIPPNATIIRPRAENEKPEVVEQVFERPPSIQFEKPVLPGTPAEVDPTPETTVTPEPEAAPVNDPAEVTSLGPAQEPQAEARIPNDPMPDPDGPICAATGLPAEPLLKKQGT